MLTCLWPGAAISQGLASPCEILHVVTFSNVNAPYKSLLILLRMDHCHMNGFFKDVFNGKIV